MSLLFRCKILRIRSIANLLILLSLALVSGVLLQVCANVYREHALKQQVERLGGIVNTSTVEYMSWPAAANSYLPFTERISEVVLNGSDVQNGTIPKEVLIGIGRLQYVEEVCIVGKGICDSDIEYISRARGLLRLYVGFNNLTDKGMRHIERMTKLRQLYVNHNMITDEGIGQLQSLAGLSELNVAGTSVTNASADFLCRMPGLRILNATNTAFDELGASLLRAKSCVETVYISERQ